MLALSLDTSSPATSIALVAVELPPASPSLDAASSARTFTFRTLAEELFLPPAKAGDQLPDALSALCVRAGCSLDDVGALAVGLGPGSFTGLRVGLAAAKGLAYARRWPVAGASSLRAVARSSSRTLGLTSGLLVAALEARRGELFLSAYTLHAGAVDACGDEKVMQASDVSAWLAQLHAEQAGRGVAYDAPMLVGPGATKNLELLRAGGVSDASLACAASPHWPSAAALVELCAAQLVATDSGSGANPLCWRPGDTAELFALAPRYLAESEAEKALMAGRVGKLPK